MYYDNTPMQYTAIFHGCKKVNLQMKNSNIFLFCFSSKHRLCVHEYSQSMFYSKNMKIVSTPVNPTFYYIKVVCKGV